MINSLKCYKVYFYYIFKSRSTKYVKSKGWITYWFSYVLHHNDAKNITSSPPPAICVILRFLTKLIVFYLFLCGLQQKIEPSWRNYLSELQNQAKHNTRNIQAASDYSSATAMMLVIFWTENNFCIISGCSNLFNSKLKNLWTSKKFLWSSKYIVFIWKIL